MWRLSKAGSRSSRDKKSDKNILKNKVLALWAAGAHGCALEIERASVYCSAFF
jgi:hypothetical protein